jgi:DNA-directed RNA polymerases I, II, and III subunit RPABC1
MKQRFKSSQINSSFESLRTMKQTQLEICELRGYTVTKEESDAVTSLDAFVKYINQKAAKIEGLEARSLLTKLYTKNVNGKKRNFLVYYVTKDPEKKLISISQIQKFLAIIQKTDIQEAILVTEVPFSPVATSELQVIKNTRIQLFQDFELYHNPTQQVDAQIHELIKEPEASKLLKAMKVKLSQLMIIGVDDPIIKFYGWEPGQLVRIRRVDDVIAVLTKHSVTYKVIF